MPDLRDNLREKCIRAVYDCPIQTASARVDAMTEIIFKKLDSEISDARVRLEDEILRMERERAILFK